MKIIGILGRLSLVLGIIGFIITSISFLIVDINQVGVDYGHMIDTMFIMSLTFIGLALVCFIVISCKTLFVDIIKFIIKGE